MKRQLSLNFAVLGGILIVILSAFLLEVMIIETTDASFHFNLISSSYSAFAVLALMLLTWRSRGLLWLILGVAGAAWPLVFTNYVIANFSHEVTGVSYEMGFYSIILGYIIIIVGSIGEIAKKRTPIQIQSDN